jgi:hypothetical protein
MSLRSGLFDLQTKALKVAGDLASPLHGHDRRAVVEAVREINTTGGGVESFVTEALASLAVSRPSTALTT